ncbi:MAG: hypothetical protein DCE92_11290 [Alphaproteobacteria bacterium]|nr:MAG: hypothetical protein DCE92_11290 [Alphaproteobacteria bacterium]
MTRDPVTTSLYVVAHSVLGIASIVVVLFYFFGDRARFDTWVYPMCMTMLWASSLVVDRFVKRRSRSR